MRNRAGSTAHDLPSEYLKRFCFDFMTHDGRAVRRLLDAVGESQLVVGTDYPADRGVSDARSWLSGYADLTVRETGAILGRHATLLIGSADSHDTAK